MVRFEETYISFLVGEGKGKNAHTRMRFHGIQLPRSILILHYNKKLRKKAGRICQEGYSFNEE